MHEVVNIHIGQSGTQIGHACWELNCIEHAIAPDGRIRGEYGGSDDQSFHTFYNDTGHGKLVPRAIFVDTEPTCIDEIRTGPYAQLFHPEQLISGKEDAANNFARGYFNIGSIMIDSIMDRIRLVVECCDSFQGFLIYHALGGGTGSGVGSHMINAMTIDYPKRPKIETCIFTSPRLQGAVVEPYNAVLATHSCIDDSEVAFLLDNEAVWDVAQKKLNIRRPSFTNINRLLAQIISSLTAPLRFRGSLNGDLSEFQTNLVPYPRIHFPLATLSPIMPAHIQKHEQNTVDQVTSALFEPANSFLTVDLTKGKYMSCVLLYRGDIDATNVNRATNHLKHSRSIKFVDWCPTGFKIDINHQPVSVVPGGDLAPVPRNCAMLANTTAVGQALINNDRKFDLMYSKRAFFHWYVGEGLEEQQLTEAMEDLHALENDYVEAGADTTE